MKTEERDVVNLIPAARRRRRKDQPEAESRLEKKADDWLSLGGRKKEWPSGRSFDRMDLGGEIQVGF